MASYIARFEGSTESGYVDEPSAEWDCTDFLHNSGYHDAMLVDVQDSIDRGGFNSGADFKSDPAAPQWVRDWSGPFTITVRRKDG